MNSDKNKICTELTVKNRIQETSDAVSLVLDVPPELKDKFKYRAGQFVTFFLTVNGEELHRSYSLASSPDFDNDFKVTIKLVSGGKASSYLVHTVKIGDALKTTPPAGVFVLPEPMLTPNLVCYAAGSGITPVISILKSALVKNSNANALLLYQNRNEKSIIFENELKQLQNKFHGRLHVQHILSQPQKTWLGHVGRINQLFLKEHIPQVYLEGNALHILCGPDDFMNSILTSLHALGVDKKNIMKESFTAGASTKSAEGESYILDEGSIIIGDAMSASEPETIEAMIDGTLHSVAYQKNRSVLDCLLDAGLNPPYSCLNGACMACIAKVEKGVVFQNDMGILSDDNVDANECLTCQAFPAAKTVKVNYDPA